MFPECWNSFLDMHTGQKFTLFFHVDILYFNKSTKLSSATYHNAENHKVFRQLSAALFLAEKYI